MVTKPRIGITVCKVIVFYTTSLESGISMALVRYVNKKYLKEISNFKSMVAIAILGNIAISNM